MLPPAPEADPEPLERAEVRRRAAGGVLAFVFRGVVVRAGGFAATIVFARYLTPDELGQAAIGASIVAVGATLSSGGLAASLIRGERQPTRPQLQTAVGMQLALTLTLAAILGAVAVPLGATWEIAALMAVSLPISVLRVPAAVTALRGMNYGTLVRIDIAENLIYHVLSVALVIAGMGAWGIAVATVVKTVIGTTLVLALLPPGLVMPRLQPALARAMLRFGIPFQGLSIVNSARDNGVNFIIAGLAGTGALGVYNLASRLMQALTLVLVSLYAVTYSAMARLIEPGRSSAPTLRRAIGMAGVAVGCVTVALGGSAPALVPSLFGSEWGDAALLMTLMCGALTVNAPLSTIAVGYLLARGKPRLVLRNVIIYSAAWIVLILVLLPIVGIVAVGLALVVAAWVDFALLSRALGRDAQLDVPRAALPAAGLALVSGALGYVVAISVGETLPGAVLAVVAGEALYLGLLWLLRRDDLRGFVGMAVDAIRPSGRRGPLTASGPAER